MRDQIGETATRVAAMEAALAALEFFLSVDGEGDRREAVDRARGAAVLLRGALRVELLRGAGSPQENRE